MNFLLLCFVHFPSAPRNFISLLRKWWCLNIRHRAASIPACYQMIVFLFTGMTAGHNVCFSWNKLQISRKSVSKFVPVAHFIVAHFIDVFRLYPTNTKISPSWRLENKSWKIHPWFLRQARVYIWRERTKDTWPISILHSLHWNSTRC